MKHSPRELGWMGFEIFFSCFAVFWKMSSSLYCVGVTLKVGYYFVSETSKQASKMTRAS